MQAATYGINVTESGTYGVNYLLEGSGNPAKPPALKFHMRLDRNCSNPDGVLADIDIAAFNPPGGKQLKYGAGDVQLQANATEITVCFEEAGYVQVNGYIFGEQVTLLFFICHYLQ
jgi:hypothetical protein